jgi:hypothetical protein
MLIRTHRKRRKETTSADLRPVDQLVDNIRENADRAVRPGKPLEFLLTFSFVFTKLIDMIDIREAGGAICLKKTS